MPQTVSLEKEEWDKILSVLGQVPWVTAHPLIMKIGEQLRQQQIKEVPAAEPQLASKGAH